MSLEVQFIMFVTVLKKSIVLDNRAHFFELQSIAFMIRKVFKENGERWVDE